MTRILERFPSGHIPVQRPFSRRNLVPAPVSVACMQLVIESVSGESKDLGNPVFVVPADLTCGQVRPLSARNPFSVDTYKEIWRPPFATSSNTSCEDGWPLRRPTLWS
jgi:hypothetical protein